MEKPAAVRATIAEELVALVRAITRGEEPNRAAAHHIADGALSASERSGGPLPSADQISLLREIARRSLWHMPNSRAEVRNLLRLFDIENLRQPHPFDDEPPGG